ncbi:hypothetical protein OESDEN_16430 [Oesophagostomum dentatum]|uniref:Uncharacterized protein n=1 Tax=Oesophagostomum dentatum TaxID=61180 RepID=A0A0B1SKW1_OESDE|nr:hypothetical protein OESDEN_16430 [Oesophagostomum dentatum]
MSSTSIFCDILLFLVLGKANASAWDLIEVNLVSEHYKDNADHSPLSDFEGLFDEFADSQDIPYIKRNLRVLEVRLSGWPTAKYGIRNTKCEEFRQFLSGVKAQKYHLRYASVKCGPMTFYYCMTYSCNPCDFQETSRANTTEYGYSLTTSWSTNSSKKK